LDLRLSNGAASSAAIRSIRATWLLAALVVSAAGAARADGEASAERARSVNGIELARVGFPGGVGLGVRAFPVPQLSIETGASTFVLATTFEIAVATLPLSGGPERKVQPVFRVGYRTMFIHEASDRVVRSALPRDARGLAEELVLYGARLDALFFTGGFAYRFRRPLSLEVALGHLSQIGSTRAVGGRQALQLRAARFGVAELRLTLLLPRATRRR
jgi:hypothetical protein